MSRASKVFGGKEEAVETKLAHGGEASGRETEGSARGLNVDVLDEGQAHGAAAGVEEEIGVVYGEEGGGGGGMVTDPGIGWSEGLIVAALGGENGVAIAVDGGEGMIEGEGGIRGKGQADEQGEGAIEPGAAPGIGEAGGSQRQALEQGGPEQGQKREQRSLIDAVIPETEQREQE